MENTNNTKPQVFISFRGKDARERFLPLLKDRLKRRKVNVFTDEDAAGVPLEHGTPIGRDSKLTNRSCSPFQELRRVTLVFERAG